MFLVGSEVVTDVISSDEVTLIRLVSLDLDMDTQAGTPWDRKTEIGVRLLGARSPQKLGQTRGTASGGTQSAETLILDFQPPERGDDRFLCLKHLVVVALGKWGSGCR